MKTKYCKHCGELINKEAVICVKCGLQVEELKTTNSTPQVIINNSNAHANRGNRRVQTGTRNKWVALVLCLFLGVFGGHKFYEGKTMIGVLYMFTAAFLGVGIIIDIFSILCKPTYY